MRKVGPTLALGLALLSYATQSETQQTAGRFRLGVDGTVLNAESGTISADAESGAIEADYGSTSAGLFASGVGVVLAGGGENLVGGLRLSFATQTQTLKFDEASGGALEQSQTTVSLLPQLAYVFSPRSRARFFLNASVGYQ